MKRQSRFQKLFLMIAVPPNAHKDPAAVALGSRKSDKKAKAARANGRKGGRPVTKKSK